MKVLFFLVHPAHFHLFKNVIKNLQTFQFDIHIVIRPKESLDQLCVEAGFDYIKVSEGIRKNSKISMAIDMVKRDNHAYHIIKKIKPNLMIGSSVEISHIGRALNIPSIITHEDDYDNMKFFSYSSFPFAAHILSPDGCRQGPWGKKTIHYSGYHELSYLHPNNFTPDTNIKKILGCEEYYLLRFSQFMAHHDFGASGISDKLAIQIIEMLTLSGTVFISSERVLPAELEKYRLTLPPSKIHDLLSFAKMFIGDSQSMAMEAAILGIPSVRFNKFADNYSITVLDELEKKYKLAIGINISNPEKLLFTIKTLLQTCNISKIWLDRKNTMLKDKIDTCEYLTWFIKEYPKSLHSTYCCTNKND
ncbi:MAG: DUF354 domain-containing protein [Bacteroidetes bacterium]|nr:DUF354 domain-containing protein [Bacteroidota bacterium]